MLSHQRGLYKTTAYKDLFEFVNGFDVDSYLKGEKDIITEYSFKPANNTASDILKNRDLYRLSDLASEYCEIIKRAHTVYATSNDEARLQRLFREINEFLDERPQLLI